MSGGGDKGSYEAAVFIELVNQLEEGASYDVMTGVSAGSMNACGLGVFKPEEGDAASLFVFGLWNSIKSSDVFGYWPGGILEGLFKKGGVLTTQPLVDFVTSQTSGYTVGKKVSFALCEINNAANFVFDYNASDELPEFYVQSAIGSSSIPLVFPSMKIGDNVFVDGGSLWNIDIPTAVRRCREVVDDDKDIIVDAILCGSNPPVSPPKGELKKYSALSHYRRAGEIKGFYDTMNKLDSALFNYPDVEFRYVIGPSESLSTSSNPIPLDFSKSHLDKCFEVGKKDARNAVKMDPMKYYETMQKYRDMLLNHEKADLSDMISQKTNPEYDASTQSK